MDDPLPEGLVACIHEFFQSEHKRPAGRIIYPEVFESSLFFPLQRQNEMAKMLVLATSLKPTTIMEIGADKGGSLYHWCKLGTVKYAIACELRGTPYAEEFERAFPHIQFLWLPTSSYLNDTVSHVASWLAYHNTQLDVLFLDGDKSMFLADFQAYYPLLGRPSYAFFHDVTDDAPKRAFEQVCQVRYRATAAWTIYDPTEGMDAVLRAERGEPCTTPYEGWLRHWKGSSCGVGVLQLRP